MREKKDLCPLFSLLRQAPAECEREKCAWWVDLKIGDKDFSNCAIPKMAIELENV